MRLSWDEAKRRQIHNRRGFDMLHAAQVLDGEHLLGLDTRYDYGEAREIATGKVGEDHFTVVFTRRGETIHVITAWRASRRERRRYQERFG